MLSFYSAFGGWMKKETKEVLSKIVRNDVRYVDRYTFASDFELRLEKMVKRHSLSQTQSSINDPVLMKLYYIYESQSSDLCQMLPSQFKLMYYDDHCFHYCYALKFILSHKRFNELEIQFKEDDCYCLRMIAPALQGNMPSNRIGLYSNKIGDEGATIVAKILKGAITPTHILRIQFSELTKYGIKILSSALPSTDIILFNLNDNKIGDDGLRHLVANLTMTCLKWLCLSRCEITDEGIIELSEVLPYTHIIFLALEGNKMSSVGFKSLTRAILHISSFEYLSISDNPDITTEDIKDFFSSMINHPNLYNVCMYEKHAIQAKDHIESINQERRKRGLKNIASLTMYDL